MSHRPPYGVRRSRAAFTLPLSRTKRIECRPIIIAILQDNRSIIPSLRSNQNCTSAHKIRCAIIPPVENHARISNHSKIQNEIPGTHRSRQMSRRSTSTRHALSLSNTRRSNSNNPNDYRTPDFLHIANPNKTNHLRTLKKTQGGIPSLFERPTTATAKNETATRHPLHVSRSLCYT